jgi:uncharacterized protein (DUF433 family)
MTSERPLDADGAEISEPTPRTWAVRGYQINVHGQPGRRMPIKFTVTAIDQADAVAEIRARYDISRFDLRAVTAYSTDYMLSMTNAGSTVHVNGCRQLDDRQRVAGWPIADGITAADVVAHASKVVGGGPYTVHDCVRDAAASEAGAP